MTFGERVRLTRQEVGYTQHQLAERVGITQSHLSHIEGRTGLASAVVARELCTALELPSPWAAKAGIEAFAVSQERKFGIAPAETYAEMAAAFEQLAASAE